MRWWRRFNETVTVEPVTFLYFLALSIGGVAWQQTLYIKFCYQEYGNLTDCKNGTWEENHPALQEKTSSYIFYCSLISFVPVLVVIPYLSGYSDRHGLRFPLLLPLIGSLITACWATLHAVFLDWNVISILAGSLVTGLCGHYSAIVMASMTYLTRDPLVSNVAQRIAVLEALAGLATTLGAIIPGPILDGANGLVITWLLCIAIYIVAAVDIVFRVRHLPKPSHIEETENEQGSLATLKSCCNFETVKALFQTILRKRNKSKRLHLHVVTAATMTGFCAMVGLVDIQFLFLTKQLGKSNTVYSIRSGISGLSTFLGNSVLGYVFTAVYPLSAVTIGVIGAVSNAVAMGLLAYAAYPTFYWASAVCDVFKNYVILAGRIYITQCMEEREQAAGMGYYATVQTLVTIVASLIFNNVYPATLSVWPGLSFNLAGWMTVLSVPALTLVRWNDIRLGSETHVVNDQVDDLGSSD